MILNVIFSCIDIILKIIKNYTDNLLSYLGIFLMSFFFQTISLLTLKCIFHHSFLKLENYSIKFFKNKKNKINTKSKKLQFVTRNTPF